MISNFEEYITKGCMRCPYGDTPQCKVHTWASILVQLKEIILQYPVEENIKWSIPVFTLKGKNVLSISALKDAAVLSFFKGALLENMQILEQQGTVQSGRIIKIKSLTELNLIQREIHSCIEQAIQIEKDNKKVILSKNPEPMPDELTETLQNNEALKTAFYALSPGRQRSYLIHIGQGQKKETREKRINFCIPYIFQGIGFHEIRNKK